MTRTQKLGRSATAETVTEGLDLSGRTMLVTGVSSGLGFETLRVLALRGARVLAMARTTSAATNACAQVSGETIPIGCELADLAAIRTVTDRIAEPIDAIIANAGVMAMQELRLIDGVEAQMFINHVAHFELITRLLDRLTDCGRIVVVSSAAHSYARGKSVAFDSLAWDGPYKPWPAYGRSKLANILFTRELAARLPVGQVANTLHPGVVDTPLFRNLSVQESNRMTKNMRLRTPAHGAATQVFLAAHPLAAAASGQYFGDCAIRQPSALARDAALAARLWSSTSEFVAAH